MVCSWDSIRLPSCSRWLLGVLGSGSTRCRGGSACSICIRLLTIRKVRHHGTVDRVFTFGQFVESRKGASLLLPWCAGVWLAHLHQASLQSPLLLCQKMVRRGDVIVLVHLQTLDGIFSQESKALEVLNQVLLQFLASMAELGCHRRFWYLREPRVQSHLLRGYSLNWICGQQPLDEVTNRVADEVRGLVVTSKDLLVELGGVLVLKG
mmetsp:Transcript_65315/g.121757  ORF Transcript_65315/g.121757 Transcript_65315/m.121757 type:complete len:208 (+) Transcript_65315:1079-1702(+)